MSRRNNPRLKRAFESISLNAQQAQEIILCAQDPKHFMRNYIKVRHPTRGVIPFELYDYQEDMVDLYNGPDYNIILSARQTGKTESISAYILWFACFQEDVTVLITSNKGSGAKEIINKIQKQYEELPAWLKPGVDPDSWNKHECRFDNGSRIVAETTSADSGRGMSISLLYCDEFAFVPAHIQRDFWTSISPTLATGGKCIISSTPNGNSNLFAELWRGSQNGTNSFKGLHVPWDAPPGRDENFKRKEIGDIGVHRWKQEYECEFLSSEVTLVDSYKINQIERRMDKEQDGDEEPVAFSIGDLDFYKKINPAMSYIVGVDVATGTGKDFSVIEVVEFPTMEQVLEFRSNTLVEKFIYSRLKNILLFLQQNSNEVYFSVENNGVGASVLALYEYDQHPPAKAHLISDPTGRRLGLSMSEVTKRSAALKLKNLLESNSYKFHSRTFLTELKNYTRQGATYKAEVGATDDCIAAHLIIMRILEEMAQYDGDAYDKVYNTVGYDNQQSQWDDEFGEIDNIRDIPLPIIM